MQALAQADYIVEAVPEREVLKRQLFERLDALAPPGAILASNTSSLSITRLAAATARPGKVVGLHFMNPVGSGVGACVGGGGCGAAPAIAASCVSG